MAGHSKWANIKHRKSAQDRKRGKQFAKLIRAIEVAAREAGTSDPEAHPTLALAVQKAKDADVPKDTWTKAAKRGAGELGDAADYQPVQYEGYGPGGVAVLVDCLTDNRNRTASDVRAAFTRAGGSLAEPGAVAFLFSRRGQVVVAGEGADEDRLLTAGLDAGLEDLETYDDTVLAWCDPSDVADLRKAFENEGLKVREAGSTMVPSSTVPIDEPGGARRILRLIDDLDEHDDVQDVFANFDIPEELIERIEADDDR